MGMRIHGGGGGYASGAQDAQWQQRRQNFDALAQAIAGGTLSNANDAFAKIQASVPAGGSMNPNGFLSKIGAALQTGDITTAQQVLAARFSGLNEQSAAVGATPQAGAATAVTATSAVGATSTVAGTSGHHGHHHHHGGGGGASPAMDLSQAILSGDANKAQSSMQTILNDLQQVADMGNLATSGTTTGNTNPMVSSAVSAATNLLQNPDFKALEDAVANGDATAMKAAWTKLVSGTSTATSSATTTTPVA